MELCNSDVKDFEAVVRSAARSISFPGQSLEDKMGYGWIGILEAPGKPDTRSYVRQCALNGILDARRRILGDERTEAGRIKRHGEATTFLYGLDPEPEPEEDHDQ